MTSENGYSLRLVFTFSYMINEDHTLSSSVMALWIYLSACTGGAASSYIIRNTNHRTPKKLNRTY